MVVLRRMERSETAAMIQTPAGHQPWSRHSSGNTAESVSTERRGASAIILDCLPRRRVAQIASACSSDGSRTIRHAAAPGGVRYLVENLPVTCEITALDHALPPRFPWSTGRP